MAKKKSTKKSRRRWVKGVQTVSTFPPEGTFTKDANSIARIMASKKVSPKGLGSGIRMIQYFINRGGKGLSAARERELEKAKQILQDKLKRQQNSRFQASRKRKRAGS
jgi:tRNA(adenine34) deaminase